jgi:hypothetical protein
VTAERVVIVICEGQTEQTFCNRILGPALFPWTNDGPPPSGRLETRLIHQGQGGLTRYAKLERRVEVTLREPHGAADVLVTTMIDLYGLPTDFPGRTKIAKPPGGSARLYVDDLQQEFAKQIGDHRFVPHISLHEFETLLFVNLTETAKALSLSDGLRDDLQRQADGFHEVEEINDEPDSAPSKRLIRACPAYEGNKVLSGVKAAAAIGLDRLRSACPHFNDWVSRLEQFARSG